MPTNLNSLRITEMWYKVNELSRKKYSQTQIGLLLGVNRVTVSRYQSMSEAEFKAMLGRDMSRHRCKLDDYRDFIVAELRRAPFLSSSQILDHLQEHFEGLPELSEKTVYNYVMRVREDEDIPKCTEPVRQMHQLPQCEYGEQAQVDYGEQWMETSGGRRVKIYFFTMILSRSRARFVYLQNVPFTSKSTVYAHHLAFKYFGGVARDIFYDQDCKLLVSENFGDYVMTEEFGRYVGEVGIHPVFMMAADPQSKGKVENLVRYVKQNFLRGRVYVNIDVLNEAVIGWMERVNGKVHTTTKLIPSVELIEERKHLLPYTVNIEAPDLDGKAYVVRSDNTILYHSNTYCLPTGTYTGKGAKVLVRRNMDLDELDIYNLDGNTLITRHAICHERGKRVSKEGHVTRVSRDILESEKVLHEHLGQWSEDDGLSIFLADMRRDRPRYYRKAVMAMASLLTDFDKDTSEALLDIYREQKVYNPNTMTDIARNLCNRMENPRPKMTVAIDNTATNLTAGDVTPRKRSMSVYDGIIRSVSIGNGGER